MMIRFFRQLFCAPCEEDILDAEYEPFRKELTSAGLSEAQLRRMPPDDRVAALEQAQLDPYDYIYLVCG